MQDVDEDWLTFINGSSVRDCPSPSAHEAPTTVEVSKTPKCGDIYISTKTKISYLNQHVPLKEVFWKIPVIPYTQPCEGVVKKQMKFNCFSEEELNSLIEKTKTEKHLDNHIISKLNDTGGRAKYRDVRKISVGLCKKDVVSHRSKEKSAFYNCFVMIVRLLINDRFREVHVKVFNTGKLEIPGIQNDEMLNKVLDIVLRTLKHIIGPTEQPLECLDHCDTVLINSNFNCGFYVNRERLFMLMKRDYKLQCSYDPCSYPGVQCKYYHYSNGPYDGRQRDKGEDALSKISFMVFRTGSVLIVGKCCEDTIMRVYTFIKEMFKVRYSEIVEHQSEDSENLFDKADKKKKKLRRFARIAIMPV